MQSAIMLFSVTGVLLVAVMFMLLQLVQVLLWLLVVRRRDFRQPARGVHLDHLQGTDHAASFSTAVHPSFFSATSSTSSFSGVVAALYCESA